MRHRCDKEAVQISSTDELSEQERIELLARASDAWERAPQNTMRFSNGAEKTTSFRIHRA